jgi:hypothetical protein
MYEILLENNQNNNLSTLRSDKLKFDFESASVKPLNSNKIDHFLVDTDITKTISEIKDNNISSTVIESIETNNSSIFLSDKLTIELESVSVNSHSSHSGEFSNTLNSNLDPVSNKSSILLHCTPDNFQSSTVLRNSVDFKNMQSTQPSIVNQGIRSSETSGAPNLQDSSKENEKFEDFMRRHIIKKEDKERFVSTNTRIGDTESRIFGGSYHIDENEYNQFFLSTSERNICTF